MSAQATLPWAGITLALAASVAMMVSGVPFWLVLAVLVVWVGSLWLVLPEPVPDVPKVDAEQASQDAMRETIEPLGQPVVVLEGGRIVLANAAARTALGAHIVGQDARIGLRHPDAMRLLDMADGESVTIPAFTGGRSLWQLSRQRIDADRWLIEMADRTSESDISRAHTDFVANASHELRTPLAAIIGYVETLADSSDTIEPADRDRFHDTVLREARRMQSLVEDLMSLSLVEAEKHDRPTERLDLGKLVARVVAEITSVQGKDRVTIDADGEPREVFGDARQLEQLLRNLVDNAMKYGGTVEPVVVRIGAGNAGEIALSVADSGPGIAAEHLPHLTRRFYRTDPGRSRQAGGTGLGLAIVKHIVERHRSRLDISSELGRGTKVEVTFPAFGDLS